MAKEKKNLHEMIIYLYLLLLLSSADFVTGQSGNGSPSTDSDSYEFNPKFNPSMGILILIFITAFFFMGFLAVYIRQCAEQEGGSVRPAISGIGRLRRAKRGVDPSIMETLPIFNYSEVKGFKIGKGALECAVCLNEFEDEETLRLLPKCDHVFHSECIDAWLDSHTTCPVCRANLVPESGEMKEANLQVSVPEGELNEENRRREINDDSQNQVSILVTDEQNRDLQQPEVINLTQIPYQNRPTTLRSTRSRFTEKFPRSHSTGHSPVQPGENCERFTLRLPEDVRKQIMSKKLDRTTSCVVFPTEGSSRRGYRSGGEGSSRRGYRSGGEGSSRGKYNQFVALDGVTRSDRWVFSMAPPFLTRKGSVGSSWKSAAADGEITGTNKAFFTSVKTPFDCLGAKDDGAGQCSTRPLV